MQVPCYPERKIAEINKKIDYLKIEYQAFAKKLRKLDPSLTDVPWTERSYQQCATEENLRKGIFCLLLENTSGTLKIEIL